MRFLPFFNTFLLSVFLWTVGEPAIVLVIYFSMGNFFLFQLKTPLIPTESMSSLCCRAPQHTNTQGQEGSWGMSSLPSHLEGWHCLCLITLVPSWEQYHHPLFYEATIQLPLRKVSALHNRGSWCFCSGKRTWEQTRGKQHPLLGRICCRVSLGGDPQTGETLKGVPGPCSSRGLARPPCSSALGWAGRQELRAAAVRARGWGGTRAGMRAEASCLPLSLGPGWARPGFVPGGERCALPLQRAQQGGFTELFILNTKFASLCCYCCGKARPFFSSPISFCC